MLVSGFLNGVVITRSLGSVGRGEYAMINFMVMILLVILGEGGHRSNIYLTSQDKSEGSISRLISSILVYGLLVLMIFLFLVLMPDSWYQSVLPGIQPIYIYLGFGTAIFFIFIRQFQGLFLGLQQYWHYNIFNTAPVVLFLGLNAVVWFATGQLSTRRVLIHFCTAMGITFVAALIQFSREHEIHLEFQLRTLKESFTMGWRATIAYLFIYLLVNTNLYIVNFWKGLAEAGFFAVAVSIATLIQRVPNVAGVVLMPKVSEKSNQNKLQLTAEVALGAFAICVVSAAAIYLVGEDLLVWLYKKEFAASYLPLAWLLPGIILFSVANVFHTFLMGKGFPPISIWGPVFPLFLNLALCIFLIPKNGIVGAAQAASLSFFVYAVIVLSYVYGNRRMLAP